MCAVDELQLVGLPVRLLGPFVLAVADLRRLAAERLARVVGVEDELDHLPVAFVQVVPVVEGVEEPVLEREPVRVVGIRHDVRVHGRLVPLGDAPRPAFVIAARLERVTGKVEVVLVAPAEQVLRGRPDLDQVGGVPRPTERNSRLVEERVDVHRLIGLARAALLLLLDEPDHRRVTLGQRSLLSGARCTSRGNPQCAHGDESEEERPEAKRGPPSMFTR